MWPQESRWRRRPGALALVGSEVLDSGGTVSEALAALGTEVGFLPCMHSVVFHQIGAPSEAFATLGTLVGFVAGQRWGWLPSLGAPRLCFQARQAEGPIAGM